MWFCFAVFLRSSPSPPRRMVQPRATPRAFLYGTLPLRRSISISSSSTLLNSPWFLSTFAWSHIPQPLWPFIRLTFSTRSLKGVKTCLTFQCSEASHWSRLLRFFAYIRSGVQEIREIPHRDWFCFSRDILKKRVVASRESFFSLLASLGDSSLRYSRADPTNRVSPPVFYSSLGLSGLYLPPLTGFELSQPLRFFGSTITTAL